MDEPHSVLACLTASTTALSGAVVYLYFELQQSRAAAAAAAEARRMSEAAHASRIEALLREQIERDREASERDDRLEDIVLGLRENADRPRTRTDPKKPKANAK